MAGGNLVVQAQSLLTTLRPYEVNRGLHVRAVAATCEVLAQHEEEVSTAVLVSAALLHDIGHAPELQRTGQHSIDGALYLRSVDFDERIVSLVAHTTREQRSRQESGATFARWTSFQTRTRYSLMP